jgi:hypothetical protein
MAKQPPEPPLLLTRREVCKMLRVSETLVRALERDGILRPVRMRTAVRYLRSDVLAAIDRLARGDNGSDAASE